MKIHYRRVSILASRIGATALVVALAALAGAPAAGASSPARAGEIHAAPAVVAMASYPQAVGFDATMIQLVNQARASAGLAGLTQARGLTQLAVWWSSQMESGATGGNLAHNPNAWTMVTTYGAANRTSWGENVAWSSSNGTTAAQIFSAYMNSPGHKANILGKGYHFIGMGTVFGPLGLFNTTEFTDQVQAGQAVVPPPPVRVLSVPKNGDFFRDVSTNVTYRLVGGAPILVSSWAPFGRPQALKWVSHTVVAHLPRYPAEGTFLRTAGSHQVYRIIGGAPVFVSSWGPFGKVYPTIDIDPAAVTHAGQAGNWSHLRAVPANGTFVRTANNGAIYRIAGGAPLWITSWATVGGLKPFLDIDPQAIAHGGQGGVWAHLNWYPSDNTYLQGNGRSYVYRVIAGRAGYVRSWASVGGVKAFTVVSATDISQAGTGSKYDHLRR